MATLPFALSPFWVGGSPYYYDSPSGVYYAPAPAGGYTVVAPPLAAESVPVEENTAPIDSAAEPIFYPANGQSDAQTESDRAECKRWAATQQNDINDASLPLRALEACMEGRGYTIG